MQHYQHTEGQVIVNITVNCTLVLNIEFHFHAINLPLIKISKLFPYGSHEHGDSQRFDLFFCSEL